MDTLQLQSYSEFNSFSQTKAGIPVQPIEAALNKIFPVSTEETKVLNMRKALGKDAATLSTAEVEAIITQFQFLIESWMDEKEKEVFNGSTLKEL